MTEAWTGRKYQGIYTKSLYEVISEPFPHDSKAYVAYACGSVVGAEQAEYFERAGSYERIIEPKYAVGDAVRNYLGEVQIIAVASEADRDGDFAYLYKDGDGNVDIAWESHLEGKVSE